MNCSVIGCTIRTKDKLAIIDDGRKRMVFCHGHQISYAMACIDETKLTSYSTQLEDHECEICSSQAYLYADEVELHLCPRHLKKLLRQSLNSIEYNILFHKHGEFQLIYEDLYTKGGYALQPL